MELNTIFLTRGTVGSQVNYTGHVSFTGEYGDTELKLTGELSNRIIAACAVEIEQAAAEVAQKMLGSVAADLAKELPAPEAPVYGGDPETCEHGVEIGVECAACLDKIPF